MTTNDSRVCKTCIHYDFNNEYEVKTDRMYGGPYMQKRSFCKKENKEVSSIYRCINGFNVNPMFKKYCCYQSDDPDLRMCINSIVTYKADTFNTKKDAEDYYKKAFKKAENKFNKILSGIEELREKYKFEINYTVDGDLYGLNYDYQYIGICVDNINFRFKI